ncbi:MAG: hypothetical protein ACI97H_001461 [Marinobacter psychrophilus]|jgi:hypothetical protein
MLRFSTPTTASNDGNITMNSDDDITSVTADDLQVSSSQSSALQRLRDRTDELELIISSLTIFALFTLPGWLFDSFSNIYTHLSDGLVVAGTISITLIAGVSYVLATCFVMHLMARAYWVGLIGLRTAFPEGINWGKTPGIGPVTKKRYKEVLLDLDTVIQRTDRLASSLFAVISLITLSALWVGIIMLITLVIAVQIGARFGLTNAAIGIATAFLLAVLAGLPLLLWLMDAQLAARFPGLQKSRVFVGFVRLLGRLAGFVYPQRLILPVQLTLQSNIRPVFFYLALVIGVASIVVVGNVQFLAWGSFSLSGEFTYLDTTTSSTGFRSTYYEDMISPKDRLRAWPRIDSFSQKGSFVTLFLPYQPLRDNMMLDVQCPDAEDSEDRLNCLRNLWSVSIGDKLVSMSTFKTAERMDIQMRGLIGIVPLTGLSPGIHDISVVWNPSASSEDELVDDRYTESSSTYAIPIAFAPDYELPLQGIK